MLARDMRLVAALGVLVCSLTTACGANSGRRSGPTVVPGVLAFVAPHSVVVHDGESRHDFAVHGRVASEVTWLDAHNLGWLEANGGQTKLALASITTGRVIRRLVPSVRHSSQLVAVDRGRNVGVLTSDGRFELYSAQDGSTKARFQPSGLSDNAYLLAALPDGGVLLADPGDDLGAHGAKLSELRGDGTVVPLADDHDIAPNGSVLDYKVPPTLAVSTPAGVAFASGLHLGRCADAGDVTMFSLPRTLQRTMMPPAPLGAVWVVQALRYGADGRLTGALQSGPDSCPTDARGSGAYVLQGTTWAALGIAAVDAVTGPQGAVAWVDNDGDLHVRGAKGENTLGHHASHLAWRM
jgi:hypothetical protein